MKSYTILHYILDFIVYSQGFSLRIISISIMQCSLEIEMFNPTHKTRFINLKSLRAIGRSSGFGLGIHFVFLVLLIFPYEKLTSFGSKKRVPATTFQFAIEI